MTARAKQELDMSNLRKIALVLFASTLAFSTAAQTHAQGMGQLSCPQGYSLIGEVCISDTTGDTVNAIKHR
jgi:hypothetical protein